MDGIGFGIGLGGTPTNAMRLSEKYDAYNSMYGNSSGKEANKQRAKEEAEYNRIVANDFKVDPKLYHKKLLPKVQEESAAALNAIAKAHEKDPLNGLNSVQQILQQYKGRLAEYQAQSKNFFDYESLDPNKYLIDPNITKILNSNPGNFKDLEEYAALTKGTKGLLVQPGGYAYFDPILKVDFNKYVSDFKNNPAAYSESMGKPSPSGIEGVVKIGSNFIPNPDIVKGLRQQMVDDPMVLRNLMFNQDPTTLPPDLDLTSKESVAKYRDKPVDEWISSNIKPYKKEGTINVPKTEKDPNADFKGKVVRVGNDVTYQVGGNIWTLTKNNKGEYWLSVDAINKNEASGKKDMDWNYLGPSGETLQTGRLQGFRIVGDQFKAVIAQPTRGDGSETTYDVDGSNANSPTVTTKSKAIDINRKPLNIGWNDKIRSQSVREYKGDPIDIFNILIKEKFKGQPLNVVNKKDTGMNSKPAAPQKKDAY